MHVSSRALQAHSREATETHASNADETDRCHAVQECKGLQRRGAGHMFGDAFPSPMDLSNLHPLVLVRSTALLPVPAYATCTGRPDDATSSLAPAYWTGMST